jgi:hypothetical protein
VAVRKNTNKKPSKTPAVLIFWLIFFIVIVCLFLAKRDVIMQNVRLLLNPPGTEAPDPETAPENPAESLPDSPPAAPPSSAPPREAPEPVSVPGDPAPESRPGTEPRPPEPAPKPGVTGRERGLYFMRVDRDGTIVRTRISRTFPGSDSPMLDALQALLRGPPTEEKDLVSLIPQGTKILNATVRGSTAYISFSEEFQYNTYGVEGYAAQLRQIVWTATEFSNVKDVQILIEGRRVDYLGESVWIGSPISRDGL